MIDPTLQAKPFIIRWGVALAGTLALIIGGVSLACWISGLTPRWSAEGLITMKANTAVGLILAGAAMLLLGARENRRALKRAGVVAASITLLIGSLTLLEHLIHRDLGIDQLLFREPLGAAATVSPNRMGPPASSSFTLIGLSLLLLAWNKRRWIPVLGLAISAISIVPAIGFLYGIYELYGTATVTGIAWPTVIALFALGLGLVLVVDDGPIIVQLMRDDSGGKLLRQMLPAVIFVPLCMGFLRTLGERADLFSAPVGRGILVLTMTVVFLLLVWRAAQGLSRSESEHRQAERALRESEERFWHMADNAPVMVWVSDADGACTFISRAWYEFTGQTPQTGLGEGWTDAIHPDDRAAAYHAFKEAMAARTAFQTHYRLIRRDGAAREMLSSATPRFGLENQFMGFIGSVMDVTEQREREAALRKSERLYRAIGESINYGVWTCDENGRNTYASDSFLKLTGITQQECSEFGWSRILDPDDLESTIADWKKCVAEGGIWDREHRVRGVDGQWHPILARGVPVRDESGQVVAWAGINLDISKLKSTEYSLRDAAELLEGTIDALRKHIAILDGEGSILRVNAAWRRFAEENGYAGSAFGVGSNYLEACGAPYAPDSACSWEGEEAVNGIRAVIRGDRPTFSLEYPCHSPTQERWFVMNVTRFSEGGALRVVISHEDVTLRRQAEQVVRDKEERLRLATEATNLGTWDIDLTTRKMVVDRRCRSFFGLLETDECTPSGLLGQLSPEDQDRVRQKVTSALDPASGGWMQGDYRVISRKDGIERWVRLTGQAFLDGDKPVRVIGTAQDITDEKLAEAALSETDRRTRALLEGLPQLIWTCAPDGHAQFFSSRWVHYTGVPEREQLGDRWIEQVHPEDRERAISAWYGALERERRGEPPEYRIEYRMRRHDGEYRWFAASGEPLYDASGKLIRWVGANTDIQSIRDAQAAVRESEEKFRNLAESMSHFAWIADGDGLIYWYNRRWFDYTGTTLEEMKGWGWKKVQHPDHVDRVVKRIQHSWDTGEPWEDTFPLRGRNGEYRWFLSRALPIHDAAGKITQWFGTNTDITEQLEAQRALTAAKESAEAANQAKDRFIAVLSHELRTPLTPVLMSVSAMEFDLDISEKIRDDLQMIRRNVELEVKLIDDLLDISRITSGKLDLHRQSLDFNGAVRHVCGMCRSLILEKGIRLHCEYAGEVGRIMGDPARLQQVFWNILKNAVKFTPESGEVFVTTQRRGDDVLLTVRDTGIGIPEDILPKIFDAFEQGDARITRQFGGLGLGLAISKAIVELHHGSILAESGAPDSTGTTITVTLPGKAASPDQILPVLPSSQSEEPRRPRLLLVEDHRDTMMILSRLLRLSGYEVTTASTVGEALERLDERDYALLVSDLGLPDATGYELMQKVRDRGSIPGIAISGFGTDEDRLKSRAAGFSEHLVKPVDVSQLEMVIQRLLNTDGQDAAGEDD